MLCFLIYLCGLYIYILDSIYCFITYKLFNLLK